MKTELEINNFLKAIERNKTFDLKEFIALQKDIELLPHYRTMGPEFEFAKLAVEVPIHLELAQSKTKINNLPVAIETDAGNVIEIACPPFVVATDMDNWESVKLRSMIITDVLEEELKSTAEKFVKDNKTLGQLMTEVSNIFGVSLDYSQQYVAIKDEKLSTFTKGIGQMAKGQVKKEHVSNAQINLKMSIEEVGMALKASNKGSSPHMEFKGNVTAQLERALAPKFKIPGKEHEFENRLAILSFFISQIPMMSLQNTMNELRNEKKYVSHQTREQNRDEFKNSAPSNSKLLVALSQVKDYMGFWLKSGLNDFAKEDSIIKQMILEINNDSLKNFMNNQTQELWNTYKPGLETYAQKDISTLYKRSIDSIVDGLSTMVKEDVIKSPSKINFPVFNDEGKSPSILTDYKSGAPFMVRPDTFVGLPEGYLIEVRGLNKAIGQNDFMKGFQMPYYRMYQELANEKSPDIYTPIPKVKSPKSNDLDYLEQQFENMVKMIESDSITFDRSDQPVVRKDPYAEQKELRNHTEQPRIEKPDIRESDINVKQNDKNPQKSKLEQFTIPMNHGHKTALTAPTKDKKNVVEIGNNNIIKTRL